MTKPMPITICVSLLVILSAFTIRAGTSLAETRLKAEGGDVVAQLELGDAYDTGTGVPRDSTEAVKWYRKAAEQGLAEAEYSLGGKYDSGDGVAQDYSEALMWYRRAAEQGHSTAQYNVGVFYFRAFGVHQDLPEAAKWYRKAAEQGNADAQFGLGAFYYAGAGVPKDKIEALAWYTLSAASGNAEAVRFRDLLERDLGTEKRSTAEQRSKEIMKEIESNKAAVSAAATATRSPRPTKE